MSTPEPNHIYVDGEYLNAHPDWHIKDSAWKAMHVLRMLQKNKLQPKHICEIGCGAGEILRQLQVRMPDYTSFDGYDISPQAITLSKKKSNERLQFYLNNLLDISSTHYDLLLIMDVFEHVEDYIGFLRSLKSKASFHIFHVPLDLSIMTFLRASSILRTRKAEGHLHYFFKETALATLSDCGFDILDMFYTCGSIDMTPERLSSRLMAILRKTMFLLNPDIAAKTLSGFSMMILAR